MTGVAVHHIMTLVISPPELRALADQMEEYWPPSRIADTLIIKQLYFRGGRLDIAIDQDYFRRLEVDNATAS